FGKFRSGSLICNQSLNSVERTDLRDTSATQFAEIRDNIDFFGRTNHYIVQLCFEDVWRGGSGFQIESGPRKGQAGGMKVVHDRLGLRPDKGRRYRTHESANHNERHAGAIHEVDRNV